MKLKNWLTSKVIDKYRWYSTEVFFSISYKKEIFELTQQIYKAGLEKHEHRLKEIKAFQERVNTTKLKTQQEGIE